MSHTESQCRAKLCGSLAALPDIVCGSDPRAESTHPVGFPGQGGVYAEAQFPVGINIVQDREASQSCHLSYQQSCGKGLCAGN